MDDVDKLLKKITKDSDLGCLGGVFCLQGHFELKIFQVKKIEDVYKDCFSDFAAGIINPFYTIAISRSEEELWRFKKEMIDEDKREFKGDLIRGDKPLVVEGEPDRNELHRISISKFCDYNLTSLQIGMNRNWMLMGILKDTRNAATQIDFIRTYVRPADPPKPKKRRKKDN